jgi:hypothetical protein
MCDHTLKSDWRIVRVLTEICWKGLTQILIELDHSRKCVLDIPHSGLGRVALCEQLGQDWTGYGITALWLGSEHQRNFEDFSHYG